MRQGEATSWFESLPGDQKVILYALRKLIMSVEPGITEEIKWNRPCYSTERGMFCYLQTTKSHVTLGFQQGALLDDPGNLLEGTGKGMRHIKVKSVDDVGKPGCKALLRQAVAL